MRTVALLIATLLIAVLMGEVAVRLIAPQQLIDANPDIWRWDERVGYRHKENADAIVMTGESPHHFFTDAYGYRINRPAATPQPDARPSLTILAIGDSFVEGLAVENEQTIVEVLARQLSEHFGFICRGLNAGTSGWDPNYYLLEAQRSLASQKIDLALVFLYVGNDIVDRFDTTAAGLATNRPRTQFKTISEWLYFRVIGPARSFIEARSHLYILIKHQAYAFFSWLGITTRIKPREFLCSERNSPRWEITAEICSKVQQVFEQHHIPVCFVLLPPIYQVNQDLFTRYAKFYGIQPHEADLEQPNRLLAATFANHSLRLIDPLHCLRGRAEQGIKIHGEIDRHLSAAGHEAVADYLFPIAKDYLQSLLAEKTPRN